jgi:deoxyhypusine synthase
MVVKEAEGKELFVEQATERIGDIITQSDCYLATQEDILEAYLEFKNSGICSHKIFWRHDFGLQLCALCGAGIGLT